MVLELAVVNGLSAEKMSLLLAHQAPANPTSHSGWTFLAACQKRMPVSFVTAASLIHELMEARDEKRLLRLQRQLAKVKLLIIDALRFLPLSKTGAELLFELI